MDQEAQSSTPVDNIAQTGSVTARTRRGVIHSITIVGQIEGHMEAPQQTKTTKYEHIIPPKLPRLRSPTRSTVCSYYSIPSAATSKPVSPSQSSSRECESLLFLSSSAAATPSAYPSPSRPSAHLSHPRLQ